MSSNEPQEVHIWNPETGITDLPENYKDLEVTEVARIRQEWTLERQELEGTERLREFDERLAREWSIETGQIENLYKFERGLTETLIEKGFQASLIQKSDPRPEYVLSLLRDQKDALQGLFDFVKGDRVLTVGYIKELHQAITRSQTEVEGLDLDGNKVKVPLLQGEYKAMPNYPRRGEQIFFYCPPEQTASEMERLVSMHSKHEEIGVAPEIEAAWFHHRFSQIHPFQDGNGRVARSLASLVLIRGNSFPFIVPIEEKDRYIDALESADSGSLRPFTQFIGRRQQLAYRNAKMLIDQMAPSSSTAAEAAEKLASLVHGRSESVNARLLERMSTLLRALFDSSNRALEPIRTALLKADPKVNLLANLSATNDQRIYIDRTNATLLGVEPFPPYAWCRVDLKVLGSFFLLLQCYALTDGLNEDIQVIPLFGNGTDSLEPIEGMLPYNLLTSANFKDDLGQRLDDWVVDALKYALDMIRKKI